MNHLSFAALVILAFAFVALGQDADQASLDANNKFSSKTAGFTVTLPTGFPKFGSSTRTQTTGSGDLQIFQFEADSANSSWIIAYYDLPKQVVQSKTSEKVLQDAREGAISARAPCSSMMTRCPSMAFRADRSTSKSRTGTTRSMPVRFL